MPKLMHRHRNVDHMRMNAPNQFIILLIAFYALVAPYQTLAQSPSEPSPKEQTNAGIADVLLPAFQNHCVKCHGKDGKVKGKVDLTKFRSDDSLTADPELLADLIEVLDVSEMPPAKEPPLAPALRKSMLEQLRKQLRTAIHANTKLPSTPIRRMNRFQYNNAVTDLFDLNVIVFPLPEKMMREHGNYFQPASGKMPDTVTVGSRPLGKSQMIERRLAGVVPFPQDLRAEHGYDNRADHLSLSPLLMGSFLSLGQSIVESPDFTAKTCGIWKTFFEAPAKLDALEKMVRDRLAPFLSRAFRRSVSPSVLARYTGHAVALIKSGESFTDAMKAVASAALASPRFLYIYDGASESGGVEKLSGYELASRLSFFLWGSIPDQGLLDLAANGKLSQPAVLAQQVKRMLADRKLKRFCDSFPTQWLQLDRIISSEPDPKLFKDFYFLPPSYRKSMDMMMEPLLIFETTLIENRSILEFIDSDYSYRSARLSNWYSQKASGGSRGPATMKFTRVKVTDRRQGGLITTAAVMTMTSGPERTKPITRGAWMAGVIFNDPPEPPPADVPPLEDDVAKDEKNFTLRERFEAHRDKPNCAGCHVKIDPLGFALENFNPVGQWRDQYANGRKVDASGVLFRKHQFKDIVNLKDVILKEKDRFARAFAEHLLSFALGRHLAVTDRPAIEKIVAKAAASDYKLQTFIHQIIQSEPFTQKTSSKRKSP